MKHLYYLLNRALLMAFAIISPYLLYAQDSTVSGTITDNSTGEAIPGVSILIEGTTSGTVTDVEGKFQLDAPSDATLLISSVGFASESIPINGRSVIDLTLMQDIQSLSEVIVVGYGTQERARVTGAISSISSEEISELPVTSLDQALQGRAAGISVANSGSPGVNPLVRIRGLGTVNNNNPLYVIDGMPTSSGLNGINPNSIESIQVLKDASASAIYGSRAANGVIIVTTKRGESGKTKINFDSYYGVQNAWKQLDLLNTEQYIAYGRDLIASDPVNFDDDPDNDVSAPARFDNLGEFAGNDTDWQDEMFQQAAIQDHNLSISGGGENSIFSLSGGYFNQDGVMIGTGFERYSLRLNSEFKLGKFVVGQTLAISRTERRNEPFSGGRSQIEHMIKMVPYIPVRDEDFVGGFRTTDNIDGTDPENPVLNARLRKNTDENVQIIGTAYASYEILDGLEYKILLGLDLNNGYNSQFTPIFAPSDSYQLNPTADIDQQRTDFISPLVSNQLSYNKTFGDHTISAVAVVERQTSVGRSTRGFGESGLTSAIDVLNIAENPNVRGTRDEYAILSYLGRVNYDYMGKYLLSASIRRDGGSRFGDEKWGTFPSVSAGWRLSEESFLSNTTFLSDLKLRGGWGKVGNDGIGNYGYQATISSQSPYVLGPGGAIVPGFTTRSMANTSISWETTEMVNLGLDLGLFDNRITASVEYFNNETQGMLLNVPVPPSLGIDVAPIANVGSVENKGFEFTAGYNKFTGDFQWSLNGNISFVKNELTSLDIGNSIAGAQFEGAETTFTEEGEPIAYFYGWVVDGIFQSEAEVESAPTQEASTAPGDIRFKDINNDGVINNDDRTKIGHFLPDFSYGFNASANYKNFDLSLFIQGVSGNEILNTNRYDLEGMPRLFNAGTAVLDRWTPTNTDTSVPRAVNGDPSRNSRISDRFIEDGSYLRIKNLTLGYTLPSTVLKGFGNGFIQSVRFYVSSQNLLTLTDYTGYDPEIGVRADLGNQGGRTQTLNSGVDYGQFPQARTFLGGIQIEF